MPRLNEDFKVALRIVKTLKTEKKTLDSSDLAKKSSTTKFFVVKIMQDLIRAGIAESVRGPDGGFKARRSPVTALDIAKAMGYHLDKKSPKTIDEEISNEFFHILHKRVVR